MKAVNIGLHGITKRFEHRVKGTVTAVDDVHLEVNPGELMTLLGPSGCGKTTTLRMVAGFEHPTRGRVTIGGENVTDLMANQRNIGFVFQNYALFPHLSIHENVAYGLKVKGTPKPEMSRAVTEVLELVGLAGYEHQFPHQLSGGEQQRVALARAVVIRPRVLLFDEPLSNLDAKLRVRTRGEIRRLQKRLAITALYVTHDQEEAMAISDRIAVMERGRIVQVDTAEQLYFRPSTEFVARFIGKINALPAQVTEVFDGGVTLDIFDAAYRVLDAPAGLATGQSLKVYLRPETVEVFGTAEESMLQAAVLEQTFLGEKVEYLLDIHGCSVSVTAYDPLGRGTFSAGQRVGVRLQAEGIRILKE